jgi:hypothetical protein
MQARKIILLGNSYRGSGYAMINHFEPKENFIDLKQGTGGQSIGRSGTPCGSTTALGKLAGTTGTFVYRADGDVVAFINAYAVYPNSGLLFRLLFPLWIHLQLLNF